MRLIMGKDRLLVLKTDDELRRSSKDMSDFLEKTSKLRFWRTHFTNHNFVFKPNKFNWQYWQTIPFFTIYDLIKIGIEPRLLDAQPIIQKNTYRLLLRFPDRKTKQQYVLYVDPISKLLKTDKNEGWKLQLSESFGVNFRCILLSLRAHGRRHHVVIADPKRLEARMKKVFYELRFDYLSVDPQDLQKLLDIFSESRLVKQVGKVTLTRSFRDDKLEQYAKEVLDNADFVVQTPLMGITTAIRPCRFAQKRFGSHAIHPRKHTLIELIEMGKRGYGEIVVTSMAPLELAWIRYKTGIFGKAIHEECACGNEWILIIKRIRKYQLPQGLN